MLLSQPSTRMNKEYDAVVIGSGYGGSVAACRLAKAGKSVAVLERGVEYDSKDFAIGSSAIGTMAASNAQVHAKGYTVGCDLKSAWDCTISDELAVIVGRGLGGGSLINAGKCAISLYIF